MFGKTGHGLRVSRFSPFLCRWPATYVFTQTCLALARTTNTQDIAAVGGATTNKQEVAAVVVVAVVVVVVVVVLVAVAVVVVLVLVAVFLVVLALVLSYVFFSDPQSYPCTRTVCASDPPSAPTGCAGEHAIRPLAPAHRKLPVRSPH